MSPRLDDGWLVVPCNVPDLAQVHISVTETRAKEPGAWLPAFRDWDGQGNRVAKVRPPTSGPVKVWLRVGGHITPLKTVTL